MKTYEELIDELILLCDIAAEYHDAFGTAHRTPLATKISILKEMGMHFESEQDLRDLIVGLKNKPWNDFMEPAYVISQKDQPFSFSLYLPADPGEENRLSIAWSIEDEGGRKSGKKIAGSDVSAIEEKTIGGRRYVRVVLADAGMRDIGYYRLCALCSHPSPVFPGKRNQFEKKSWLIITPDRCYMPAALENNHAWGLSANLYSIRSSHNWGVGDFTDLKGLIRSVAGRGGGFVGINPLHAIPNKKEYGISPYSPISRIYKNFIYLDLNEIPDIVDSNEAQEILGSEGFRTSLKEARAESLIDYDKIAMEKRAVLSAGFEYFLAHHYGRDTSRDREFQLFLQREGTYLESYALFTALWEHMCETRKTNNWQEWPPEYLNYKSDAVNDFRNGHAKEILFNEYAQWLIDTQHRDVAAVAQASGMAVGIYHDLAIGSIGGGSHAWLNQDLIAGAIDIGAPPDEFSIKGQNWGIRPMVPARSRETGYQLFAWTIRENMRHNGALRIDHALGFFHMFWIPQGKSPAEGTYVRYPAEDLLRIIALESVRNRTMVVAEDLGNVGEGVHAALERFGILSYRVLYFERNYPDPSFKRPEQYPKTALCTVTTHDLPTLPGFWTGRDIQKKRELLLFRDDQQADRYMRDRERDKRLLVEALKSQNVFPPHSSSNADLPAEMTNELFLAVYRYLALTPCSLVAVSLDDLTGTPDQQNLPGARDPYPNWRQKTPLALEEIVKMERLAALAKIFKETPYKNNEVG